MPPRQRRNVPATGGGNKKNDRVPVAAASGLTPYPLLYLGTGVVISLWSQRITNLRFFSFEAHVLPWVKFTSSLCTGLLMGRGVGLFRHDRVTRRQRTLMVVMGLLETTAYVFFCLGFGFCGAGTTAVILPALGQILTAASTRFLLSKRLPMMKYAAVLCVTVGILSKAWDVDMLGGGAECLQGMLCLVVAATCYSLLGVSYEALVSTKGAPVPSHSHIMLHSSIIGTVLSSAYEVIYVFPRWNELIQQPLESSGVPASHAILMVAVFGAMYNVHTFAQGLVFQSDGALGVGLANAVRGSIINIAASLLFCPSHAHRIQDCLSVTSLLSGLMATTGGVMWTLSGSVQHYTEAKNNSNNTKENQKSQDLVDKKEKKQ